MKKKKKKKTKNMKETEEKIDIKTAKPKEPSIVVYENEDLLLKAAGYDKAITGLQKAKEQANRVVNLRYNLDCFPFDGYIAINAALKETYGYTEALGEGFWGMSPPSKLSIKTGLTTEVQVFIGKLAPPAWDGGYIQMFVNAQNPMALGVAGAIKQKFEPAINKLLARAKQLVTKNSILMSNATEHDMNYIAMMRAGHDFDPVASAPKFMDVSNPPILILPRHIQRKIRITLWDVIRNPDDFRYNKVPVKNGVLLSGPPGVGKTLVVLHTAKLAVECGWTVIKLATPQFFIEAYNMATFLAPCVLIVEDVDKIFGGPRNPFMDQILDRLDGIATKDKEVITVCTTNYPDKINEAIRRGGRMGRRIDLKKLDGEASGRFVKSYAGDYLIPDIDLEQVGQAFDDFVPSDITEGINLAKQMAIGEFGREIKGQVTTDMLVDASTIIKEEKGLYTGQKISQAELNLGIVQAAWWIQMGKEIPVEIWHNTEEYFRGGREKPTKGRQTESLTITDES